MEQIALHPELNYLTQIVVLLFEDMSQPEGSDTRYCVDLLFSPGVKRCHDGASLSEPTKSTSTSALLKGSPELETKFQASHWVKRLPPIFAKRGLEDNLQSGASFSVPSTRRKLSEPFVSLRSASDSCLMLLSPSAGLIGSGNGSVVLSSSPVSEKEEHEHSSVGEQWLRPPCGCWNETAVSRDV